MDTDLETDTGRSGAGLTRVLLVLGIAGVFVVSPATLLCVVSGTVPAPADIF